MSTLQTTPKQPRAYCAKEYKVVCLKETPLIGVPIVADPKQAYDFLLTYPPLNPYYNPEVENFVILMLNTRRRVTGHHLVSHGTLDTLLVHPREVFRPAIVMNAAAIILSHNHPSGDPCPSEADIKVTRDLIRAGQLLKIEVLDHIICGVPGLLNPAHPGYCSLKELGYFCL